MMKDCGSAEKVRECGSCHRKSPRELLHPDSQGAQHPNSHPLPPVLAAAVSGGSLVAECGAAGSQIPKRAFLCLYMSRGGTHWVLEFGYGSVSPKGSCVEGLVPSCWAFER
jgi:hypothetical protein